LGCFKVPKRNSEDICAKVLSFKLQLLLYVSVVMIRLTAAVRGHHVYFLPSTVTDVMSTVSIFPIKIISVIVWPTNKN
jgi:hypothetical protein